MSKYLTPETIKEAIGETKKQLPSLVSECGRYHYDLALSNLWNIIAKLPDETPEPLVSYWKSFHRVTAKKRKILYKCDYCKSRTDSISDFCPSCGAIMKEVIETGEVENATE